MTTIFYGINWDYWQTRNVTGLDYISFLHVNECLWFILPIGYWGD